MTESVKRVLKEAYEQAQPVDISRLDRIFNLTKQNANNPSMVYKLLCEAKSVFEAYMTSGTADRDVINHINEFIVSLERVGNCQSQEELGRNLQNPLTIFQGIYSRMVQMRYNGRMS